MTVRVWRVGSVLVFLALSLLLTAGCGSSGPTLYKVSGTLTHGGEPIPGVEIVFFPDDTGKFRESFATTDKEGKFTMKCGSQEGVAPGGHTVFIRDPAAMMGMADQAIKDAVIVGVLKKYGNEKTSPMKITVDADMNDYELKLD